MYRAVFDAALDAILIFDENDHILDANRAVETVLGRPLGDLVGRRAEDLAAPESVARLSELQRALRANGELRSDYDFVTENGEHRCIEFTARADFIPGRHMAVLRDCTERVLSREALELRAEQHAAIAELGLLAVRRLAPQQLMDEVVARVAATLRVEHVALLERLPGGESPVVRASFGWTEDPGVHSLQSGLTVAVRSRESTWGTLEVRSDTTRRFSENDVDFLRGVSNTLALAVETARDDEELRRRSAEITRLAAARQRIVADALDAEDQARERISQQLHDDLLQSLFVIRQDLAQADANPGRVDLLRRARDGVDEAIRNLRAAVFDLHPVVLAQGGLRPAVGAVAAHHAGVGGFEVSVDIQTAGGNDADRLLLSLVRELLANVVHHASARNVTVTLRQSAGELVLEVADDGRGIDRGSARAALAGGHIGLASAAERVEALGGRLELLDRPGGGTIARASIPAGDRED
jgi:PAS domain S-box-containing protein